MVRRLFLWALFLVGVVGVVLSASLARQARLLERRRAALVQEVGDMPIDDPGKMCVLAIPSEDAMHFRWRLYLPASHWTRVSSTTGGSSDSWQSEASETVAELRFRMVEDRLMVYRKLRGSSSLMSVGTRRLDALLEERWEELEITQLGSDGPVAVEPDEVAVLLRVRMPEAMRAEARRLLTAQELKRIEDSIVTIRIGNVGAFEEEE